MIRRFPSLYLLSFVIMGIVLADKLSVSPYLSLSLAALALAGASWFWRRSQITVAVLLLGLVFAMLSTFH